MTFGNGGGSAVEQRAVLDGIGDVVDAQREWGMEDGRKRVKRVGVK